MMYALNLNEDNRILSATYDQYAPASQPRVDALPDSNVSDYLYVNGEYVYDPIPDPPEPRLSATAKMMLGEYFNIDNTIYQATTTIPAGDTVIPGTNCVVVNMADALNELKA